MSDDGEIEIGSAVKPPQRKRLIDWGERDMSDGGERKPLYFPNGIHIHVGKESIAKVLDIASWLVAVIVTVAVLTVLFGNEETLAFAFFFGGSFAFASAGYLLAIFLHFKSKSLN